MKKFIIILVVLGVIGIVGFRLVSNKKHIDSRNQIKDTSGMRVAVNVATATNRVNEKNINLVGTVRANQVIEIKSEVSGKVTGLYFELGDYVTKGKTIARIDNRIRELGVDNAVQALDDARRNYERYKNLYEGGAATKAQLDQYKLALENAEIKLEQARKELSNTTITAPFSGYITAKAIENGAFVNVASPIATIVDISQLKVELQVPERDVYKLKVGDPVTITATVYPGVVYTGKITFIGYQGDASHNYPIEVAITNQKNNPLRAGTYVDVAFNKKSDTPSLQIPREALIGSLKDAKVYVVDTTNNIAKLKSIVVGEDNGNYLEVVSGLKEGEVVVTTGQINLEDGSKVAIIK